MRADSLATRRLTVLLLGLFASLALAITATGISGVIAFSVSQRTREIGIRLAMGAAPRGVLIMVLRQGMALVLVGVSIGLVISLAASPALSNLLFEVGPTDPATFLLVLMVLVAVAATASFVPARRAVAVDPIVALRTL